MDFEAFLADGRRVKLFDDGRWTVRAPARGAGSGVNGFRKVAWGVDRSGVIAAEGREPDSSGDNYVTYELLLAQLTATALYLFVDDVLTRAKYLITQEHSHDGAFLMDFRTLGDFLGKKYGPPTSVEEFWNNDLYKDSPNEWGLAVSAGHLSRYEIWILPETDIYLVLAGDNYQVRLEIEYTAKALAEFETAVKTAAILDDL